MKLTRIVPCVLAMALLAPSALAAPSLQASAITLTGSVELSGDASAILALADLTGFSWDVASPSGELIRHSAATMSVDHPLADTRLYEHAPEWETSRESLTDVILTSKGVAQGGGLLALGPDGLLDARSERLAHLTFTADPVIEQVPADARVSTADTGTIHHALSGDYIAARLSDAVLTVRGDFTLILYGPTYELVAAGIEARTERTGEIDSQKTGYLNEGRTERHVLTLVDAVLRLSAPEGVDVYTTLPDTSFTGSLWADDAEGAIVLGGHEIVAPEDGDLTWDGAAHLTLTPLAGHVLATAPSSGIATAGAIVAQGPAVGVVIVALVVLAGGAVLALVMLRRRKSGAEELELALLAMEERRWDDALPRLTRVAKTRPDDAGIQIDRALCLEQVGRFPDAAKAYERALRVAPRHAEAHFYYARTLAKMSEREAARVHLETALEHDPRLVEMARGERALRGL